MYPDTPGQRPGSPGQKLRTRATTLPDWHVFLEIHIQKRQGMRGRQGGRLINIYMITSLHARVYMYANLAIIIV